MPDTACDRWKFRRAGACCYRCDGCVGAGVDAISWNELFTRPE